MSTLNNLVFGLVVASLVVSACNPATPLPATAAPTNTPTPMPTPRPTSAVPTNTPTPLPTPPSIFSESIQAFMPWAQCQYDLMEGVFQRPPTGPYAGVPYLSEFGEPGQLIAGKMLLDWQEKYMTPVLREEIGRQCADLAMLDDYDAEEADLFVTEFGKASAILLTTGLMSPWMDENCHEWQRTKGANYISLRAGSERRRGEQSALLFDWHYAEVHVRLLAACR